MAKNARMLASKGVRDFKIKVHAEVEKDVARVEAIRAEVGPQAHLTIDANQSCAPKDAESRIDLAEQPVKTNDLD